MDPPAAPGCGTGGDAEDTPEDDAGDEQEDMGSVFVWPQDQSSAETFQSVYSPLESSVVAQCEGLLLPRVGDSRRPRWRRSRAERPPKCEKGAQDEEEDEVPDLTRRATIFAR